MDDSKLLFKLQGTHLPDEGASDADMVYVRLMHTRTNVFYNRNVTYSDLIALLLLHFKVITAEQLTYLLPNAAPNTLSCMTSIRAKDKSPQRNALKSITRNNCCVYCLTESTYMRLAGMFPAEYLKSLRISPLYGRLKTAHIEHGSAALNIPYRILGDMKFMAFRWFTRLPLSPDKSMAEVIANASGEDPVIASSGSKIPDGIISFTNEPRYVLIEQDSGVEGLGKLSSKHVFYGGLFSSQRNDAPASSVIYSVSLCDTGRKVYARKGMAAAGASVTGAYRYVAGIMHDKLFMMLRQAEEYIENELGNDSGGSARKNKNALKLIRSYYMSDGSSGHTASLSELKAYTDGYEAARKALSAKRTAEIDNARVNVMRRALRRALSDRQLRSYDGLRYAVGYTGLSYIITGKDDFDRYARYMLPRESGFTDWFRENVIVKKYGKELSTTRYHAIYLYQDGTRTFTLRNVIECLTARKETLALCAVEEISHDEGGRYRMHELFCGVRRTGKLDVCLLADGEADVADFFADCGAAAGDRRANIRSSFIDYSVSERALHVLRE